MKSISEHLSLPCVRRTYNEAGVEPNRGLIKSCVFFDLCEFTF